MAVGFYLPPTLKNPKLNPAWTLKEGENYSALFHMGKHKGRIKSPIWDDRQQSCAKWHHVGECNDAYERAYSHYTKVPENTKRNHERLIRECIRFRSTGSKE
eukprot:6296706-Ditylum_brightwellii.AAC.1